jgi:hypothetical protein
MTALTSEASVPFPTPETDHGRASFVIATVALWLSAMGGFGCCLLWIGALSDPDFFLVLAVAAFAGVWPAAILALVSVWTLLHAWRHRHRVVFGLSVAALACHAPLTLALLVIQPFERLGAW